MRSRLLPLVASLMIAASIGLAAILMAGGGGFNPTGMMAGFNPGRSVGGESATRNPITIDDAVRIAQQTAAGYSSHALVVDEVMEFQNNFYASIKEQDTGIGAFEILINRSSGAVSPEIGPNMMWNTAYGSMARGGMMGTSARSEAAMTVSKERAATIAQGWLDHNLSGMTAMATDSFHGYYTVDFEKGGRLVGMLSVNGGSGQVWLHTWHGAFVQYKDFAKK